MSVNASVANNRIVVNAVSVTADRAKCPCGEMIDLTNRDSPSPVFPHYAANYMPQLVAVICPDCSAEVRLDQEH